MIGRNFTFAGLAALAILFSGGTADAGDKVLFYMHGSDLHGKSAGHKDVKNYEKVVSHLDDAGFDVVFEIRPDRDTEAETVRTAKMVKDRIIAGTAPEDIYIGGFSYGAMISLKVAGLVGDNAVNVALFCDCPEDPSIPVEINYKAVKGRVLSIVDTEDQKFGSCEGRLPNVTDFTEKTITSGKGHKVFKLGKGKFIKKWAPLFIDWAG